VPTFDVATNRLDYRESRFDHIRTGQAGPKQGGNPQSMHHQSFLQTLFQAACGAWIQIYQFAQKQIQPAAGIGVFAHPISAVKFLTDVPVVLFGEMTDDVADFVYLTSLHNRRFAGGMANPCKQCFASIQDIQTWNSEINSALL